MRYSVAALLLLLVICAGFYWRLTLTNQYIWFDHPDMAYLEIPRLQFEAREIHAGRMPFWNSHLWAGQPLIGGTQPGPLYPFNLLFCLLPLKNGYLNFRWLNLYYVFIHFQAAVAAWWLARELGRSRKASLLAGCLFALGGFVGSVAWLDVINGTVWTPLMLLFALRSARGERPLGSAALGGLALGISWLSGHHELPLLASYAMVFVWIWTILRAGRAAIGAAAQAGVFFGVAVLAGAAQVLPTIEYGRLSLRWVGIGEPVRWNDSIPYAVDAIYSVPWRALPGLVVAGSSHADASLFAGVAAVALAAIGVLAFWGDWRVRLLAALGALALVFTLGAATPLHGLLYSFAPGLGKARVPSRAIHLVHLALSMLAAYGADAVLTGAAMHFRQRLELVLAGAGAIFLVLAMSARLAWNDLVRDGLTVAGVMSLSLSAALAMARLGRLRGPALAAALVALALMELSQLAQFSNKDHPGGWKFAGALLKNRDVAAHLRGRPEPVRVAKNDQLLPENFGEWNGVEALEGYSAGVAVNIHRFPFWTRRGQAVLSVTHWLGKEPQHADQVRAFEGAGGVGVYANPEVFPRVRVVHESRRISTWDELSRLVSEPGVDLRTTALLLSDAPQLENCPVSDETRIVERTSDRLRAIVQTGCRGMMLAANTFYPGWNAYVDGKRQPVLEVYGAIQGVVVESGAHEVLLAFEPGSVYTGLVLSALGLLAACAAVLSRR